MMANVNKTYGTTTSEEIFIITAHLTCHLLTEATQDHPLVQPALISPFQFPAEHFVIRETEREKLLGVCH